MSGQRARSSVTADHRSAHPNIPGVPWWGAVLITVTATAAGFAYDAGSGGKELTSVFAGFYAIGCVAAVLAVRQSGLFTAVIQPPLIVFASVPGAYWLFRGAGFTGIKDTLINCGYPLIERFPLMLFTSAAVLLIGMARWYFGTSARNSAATAGAGTTRRSASGRTETIGESITATMSGLWSREPADDAEQEVAAPPGRRHTIDRPARAARPPRTPTTPETARAPDAARAAEAARVPRPARVARPMKRAEPSRSRHIRPPLDDVPQPAAEQVRRPRPSRHEMPPLDPSEEPRRRRAPSARDGRDPLPPRDRDRPNPYERPGYDRPDRPDRPGRSDDNDYAPYEPPPARPRTPTNGSSGTHHPVSRVRYRGSEDGDTRSEHRTRPRKRSSEAEAWEYDI